MMARMLTQVPLPLLPGDAAEIAPGVGMVTGPDGSGVMWVHGLATFAWDAGDEAGRRLAAVQLWKLKAATQAQVAEAFGVIPVSVWRWEKALAAGGVAGLVPDRKGPRRASKLTPGVVARIRELDGQGLGKAGIAAAAGVSESSVRNVLRPAGSDGRGQGAAAGPAADPAAGGQAETRAAGDAAVLPDPVARDAERALARFGLLGEGAVPVFTPGARYPLAGLLRRCPRWRNRAAGVRSGPPTAGSERVLRAGGDAGRAGVLALLRRAAGRGRDRSAMPRWAGCWA
jgi:hypothetical protein